VNTVLHHRRLAPPHSRAGDMRDASVSALQRRFGVDLAQAQRVTAVALALYDGTRVPAGDQARRELAWACALHEVGLMVSHHDHHRHSAYLLAHADAPGFSQSQQQRLGELVLGQRGGLRKVDAALADDMLAWQMLCLRLAVIQCHARTAVDAQALSLRARGCAAHLGWAAGWAAEHPRALFLLQEEAQAWARSTSLRLQLPA
jgi:exopolyphosphatase/guanosine-5'-triphosphate,3'-diphosphate pyrophosphatase